MFIMMYLFLTEIVCERTHIYYLQTECWDQNAIDSVAQVALYLISARLLQ